MVVESSNRGIIMRFLDYFPGNNDDIRLFFAPGRVNLIGEHTDYNGGYVLPAALTMGTYMAVRSRTDGTFHMHSANFPEHPLTFTTTHLTYKPDDPWGNYPRGIIKELFADGVDMKGADVYFQGNIPNGAGLSSSASIGMVTAYAFSEMAGRHYSMRELAEISRRMENDFIGVNTGMMDQYAVGCGKQEHALLINCATQDVERVPLKLGNCQLVITNTHKRRGLADSKYNERRAECEQGLRDLQKGQSEIQSLGEITLADLERFQENINNPVVFRRLRHVVSENERVRQAVHFLRQGDLPAFGQCMRRSHESLRDDYEVSCHELDVLFDLQKQTDGCIGTRMTGAGFGGCTISIVHQDAVQTFQNKVADLYQKETSLQASFYVCKAGDGVTELNATCGIGETT